MASPVWTASVAIIALVILLPVFTILVLALTASGTTSSSLWGQLGRWVLPRAMTETALILAGVGVVTLAIGTVTAWIVTMYRFPGRELVDRLLVLPLAIPTYIVAYCYVEILGSDGPLRSALHALAPGIPLRDIWLPDVRTLTGAVLVISLVLYPYVYLAARASFVQQSVCALEVARTLGRTPFGAFWGVGLPLARPALAAGVTLALMECLNDLGAMQYLGIETLTVSIYTTWLQRSNLAGAAQLALVMLAFVGMLFAAERYARGHAHYHHTTGRYRAIPFSEVGGWRGYGLAVVCALPFLLGFMAPALVLARNAAATWRDALGAGFWQALANSLTLAVTTAAVAVLLALILAYARRVVPSAFNRPAVALTGLGYAIPGTVLALGLMIPLAGLDNFGDGLARQWRGRSTGLILSGSLFAIVLALTVRFLAISLGSIEAGLERISPNLDAAARTLGETALSALRRVHLPLLLPALATAALLVFVDAMKELPATLLLRPFNFETLSTHVYALASLEQVEAASVGAVAIVLVGLVPVLLLHKAVADGRSGT